VKNKISRDDHPFSVFVFVMVDENKSPERDPRAKAPRRKDSQGLTPRFSANSALKQMFALLIEVMWVNQVNQSGEPGTSVLGLVRLFDSRSPLG